MAAAAPPLLAADVNAAERARLERQLAANVVKLDQLMATASGYVKRMNLAKEAVLVTGAQLGVPADELEAMIEESYNALLAGC